RRIAWVRSGRSVRSSARRPVVPPPPSERTMRRRLLMLAVCSTVLGARTRVAAAEALEADPALLRGELENGMRYVILRHAEPPGRATVWLHMHTGSTNETDRQRGLAHYLEHMAFNGSKNFPAGSLVPFFESLGLTFGRDQNAFTNREQTT